MTVPRFRKFSLAWLLLACLFLAPACSGGGGGAGDAVNDAVNETAQDAVDIVDRQVNTVADQNIDDITNNVKDAVN
ncbi:MAG: hypothetical protein KQH53_19355 [Desulfarculaceae bacterium]|nr:hypothetical protein [Desulfarculaceae bacterium]